MALFVLVSVVLGLSLGFTLARFARPLALALLLISLAPLGLLYIRERFFPAAGETNFGILAIIILFVLAPGALAMFFASWFRD